MRRATLLMVIVTVQLSLSGTASGMIWYVHPDSTLNSIQVGLDSCSTGDTVLVAAGTYYENLTWPNTHSIDLVSESGPATTVIDAGRSGTVIRMLGVDSATVVSGFTIRNGYSAFGTGGIYCCFSSPTITGNMIADNISLGLLKAGGITCWEASPTINDNTITGNISLDGGGVLCRGECWPTITNNVITENTANKRGGGICILAAWVRLIITNNRIASNTASSGAGVYCSHDCRAIITNNLITGNAADSAGGGIECYNNSSPSITNNIITGNTASFGGGICCYHSNPSLTNVTISGNTGRSNGGGIYCYGSSPSLVNCILWNDAPHEIYIESSSITANHSDIQGGWEGEGNIDSDPLFVGTGEHPFSLQENSPCIDAGTPDTTGLHLPAWDIIGNQRIWDGDGDEVAIIDVGAYEYGAPVVGIVHEIVVEPTPHVLLGNYPNPFSPQTTIQYSLCEDRKVSLKIYNLLGQEIRELVGDFQQSGMYSLIWNGRDNSGRRVPSGPYFLRLKAGEHTATRKLCVVR